MSCIVTLFTYCLLQNNFSNINNNNNTKSVENNVLDFSQGYSATHFQVLKKTICACINIYFFEKKKILIISLMQGRSTYQEHYGYFQSSLLPGNKFQENQ